MLTLLNEMATAWRFGPFLLDEREHILRVGERTVELAPKGLQTLVLLVRQPGRLVTRAELIEALWPETVVEEGNLHSMVSAVRKALAEHDPSGTTYVQTIRGRGYRFVQPVEPVGGVAPMLLAPAALPPPPAPRPSRSRLGPALLLAGLAVIAFLLASSRGGGRPPAAAGRRAVAVIGFLNVAGQPDQDWLDTAFSEMLAADLAQHPGLRLLPAEEVARVRRELGLVATDSYGRETLRRVARDAAADWVLAGSYVVLPGPERRVRLDVRLQDTASGETLATVSQVGSEAELFEVVSVASEELCRRVGLSVATQGGERLKAALPLDPGARRAYTEGLGRLRRFDARTALPHLERSAQAAPAFAGTALALSQALRVLGDEPGAEQQARRAVELAAGLPARERLPIEANLARVTRTWDQAAEAYRQLWTLEADAPEHGLDLVETQIAAGRAREALATLEELRLRLPRGREDARVEYLAAGAYEQLSDHAHALESARRSVAVARRQGATLIEARALIREGFALRRTGGTPVAALEPMARARALAEAAGDRSVVLRTLSLTGTLLSDGDDEEGARQAYLEGLTLARELGARAHVWGLLLNLALSSEALGDLRGAQSWLDEGRTECQALRSSLCEGRMLTVLGGVRLHLGDLAGAERLLLDARQRQQQLKNPAREAEAVAFLADVALWRGRLQAADALWGETLALDRASGQAYDEQAGRLDRAQVALAAGRAASELPGLRRAVEQAARDGVRTHEAYGRALLGLALLETGDAPGAERESARAMTLVTLPRVPYTSFGVSACRARVLLARGEREPARALIERQLLAAQAAGIVSYELDARLLRARWLALAGSPARARESLADVAREARAKGYGWVALQADQASRLTADPRRSSSAGPPAPLGS